MIERTILIGLITNEVYIKKIRKNWDSKLLSSKAAAVLATLAMDYFNEFGIPCGVHIGDLFFAKLAEGRMDKELATEIEEDILPELSEEFISSESINPEYLYKATIKHFNTSRFKQLRDGIENIVENGKGSLEERLTAAEDLREKLAPIKESTPTALILKSTHAARAVRRAYNDESKPIIEFPGVLGKFWNRQFQAGGFISFLAPEKRGKTFLLLDIAMMGIRQGCDVAFFQAGDMNEGDQLMRITSYITQSAIEDDYTDNFHPVRDCIKNQFNECRRPERDCDCGCWTHLGEVNTKDITKEMYIEALEMQGDYTPCHGCKEWNTQSLGAVFLQKKESKPRIDPADAQKAFEKWMSKQPGNIWLDTYANGELDVRTIDALCHEWWDKTPVEGVQEREKIILIDYADLLVCKAGTEFRHQQNQIWKDLRRLSQKPINGKLPLVISPTQSDAGAYSVDRITMKNFSEDKRKFAHVTAMYGLNQDTKGKDKAIGLIHINEIIKRKGGSSRGSEVCVLQNLDISHFRTGSMFLGHRNTHE